MKRIMKGIEYLCGCLLILLSVLIFAQVLLRNFLGYGLPWSEEMARYLLLSMVLLMSPVLFLTNEHVGLDFFSRLIPSRSVSMYRFIVFLFILFFYGVYIYSHLQFTEQMGDVRSPSLNIPNSVYFMAGLIGACLGVLVGIYKLANIVRAGETQ